MDNNLDPLKRQLIQLKELQEAGALSQAQYEESKAALERRLLDLVLQGAPAHAGHDTASRNSKPSRRLLAALAVGIAVIAAAGYWWKGSPSQIGVGPGSADASVRGDPAGGSPHATNSDQIAAMIDRLAVRLIDQPQDAEGWATLARSYSVLGRHPEALKAYEHAVALRKDDATLQADYADSLAVKNNRSLAGEPMKWVERALKLDPRNLKALSLAGTHAFVRKDYVTAVKYWEQVIQIGPADNNLVQQVEPSLAEARELAGLLAGGNQSDMVKKPPAASAASVSGTVMLATALRQQANPDDTVFIFARAAEGSRMPLAIVRKQVRDLPFQFTLDDSAGMSPASKLSGVPKVIVGARISKSGSALPQPGDLSGQSGPVSIGATGLQLEIRDLVKP
ncbi:c-type cytochrome biogenesis protein CcmI [Rhodoferax sp.]|jgi:cytochrome c-type biogenesis protein CcmH|uniref:c-type cytochrome biogenesis protein CcmI n=1 Tax=Rhodoferax sp. TaxID=50421 RepID=UPI0027188B7C|nr:c-type cytochrome biogenesis protein CcmI [Rhodoferax sp.]MDO9196947.1 c-type cytochrome biogenesis protein CcmI [Rhodoferax sp.]